MQDVKKIEKVSEKSHNKGQRVEKPIFQWKTQEAWAVYFRKKKANEWLGHSREIN